MWEKAGGRSSTQGSSPLVKLYPTYETQKDLWPPHAVSKKAQLFLNPYRMLSAPVA